jgi:hypothetical protein
MKDFFNKDNFFFGFISGLVITILSCAVIYLIIFALKADLIQESKAFLFAAIPEILLMRWYAKMKLLKSMKGIVLCLFITLGAIIYLLYYMGHFANAFNWKL